MLLATLGLVPACGDDITNVIARADVALFANTNYVDFNPPATGADASNTLISLASMGFSVNTFTDSSAAGFTGAISNARVLVIPEPEVDFLAPDLDAAAQQVIANYVEGGGTLVVIYPPGAVELLNTVFGFTLTSTFAAAPYTLNSANASGTTFQGGPGSLPQNDATETIDETTLPAGSSVIYQSGTLDAAVAVIPVGTGQVIALGYDWFDAAPNGTQDGGWNNVLYRAITY